MKAIVELIPVIIAILVVGGMVADSYYHQLHKKK